MFCLLRSCASAMSSRWAVKIPPWAKWFHNWPLRVFEFLPDLQPPPSHFVIFWNITNLIAKLLTVWSHSMLMMCVHLLKLVLRFVLGLRMRPFNRALKVRFGRRLRPWMGLEKVPLQCDLLRPQRIYPMPHLQGSKRPFWMSVALKMFCTRFVKYLHLFTTIELFHIGCTRALPMLT